MGSISALKNVIEQPETMGFIGANTYAQLHDSTLSALFGILEEEGLPFSMNKNSGYLMIGDANILCRSLENFNMIRGIEVGWFWLDEVRDTRLEAFQVLIGRLRCKKARFLNGRLTSSPAGFNWLYEYFAGPKKTDDFELVQGSSLENPFLPDGYIDTMKQSFDERVYQQEVEGQFVAINQGRIYYAFNRELHISPQPALAPHQLLVGMDFNVNPMTAVVGQYVNERLQIVDELFLPHSNTTEMGEELKRRYGNRPLIIPDATGKALKTSAAGLSDHEILRRMGFQISATTNPYRGDRYNAVNNLFSKNRIIIDPRCKQLVRDLEQVSFKEGTNLPDSQKDPTLTHISDALGYLVWHLAPIERPKFDVEQFKR